MNRIMTLARGQRESEGESQAGRVLTKANAPSVVAV